MTKTVFRNPAEFKRFFGAEVDDIASAPPKSTSPRLSTAELQRRIMGSAYKRAVDHSRKVRMGENWARIEAAPKIGNLDVARYLALHFHAFISCQ